MKTAMFGLILGVLAVGGLIAGGALMTGQAYAQTSIASQANVNEDNDVQEAFVCAVATYAFAITPTGQVIEQCAEA
jgi:hypothetical protein